MPLLSDMRGIGARFVYILRSDSDQSRHYVGRTANVDERLAWHNAGPCGYTVQHRPWSIVVSLDFQMNEPPRTSRNTEDWFRPRLAKRHFEMQ